MREKNPPEPKPFIAMKATSGAILDDTGQIVSMLSALMVSARTRAVIGPTESPNTPNPTRPTADARLKVAQRHEASDAEAPTELAYSGMKKGGTRSGKVAMPEPRKRRINLGSRKRPLQLRACVPVSNQ